MSFIVKTQKLVSGGDCLSKINGKNVFIPFSLPDEELEIEITKSFRDYDIAKITQIISASSQRVQPFCPLYENCGGCNLQHIEPAYQQKLRKSILKDSFEREGIPCPEIEVISGRSKNYRCRIQLTNGGFNKKMSNDIVSIGFCPIATEEINDYLKNTNLSARPHGRVHIFGDKRILSENKVIIADEKPASANGIKIQGSPSLKKQKHILQQKRKYSGTNPNQNNRCEIALLDKKIAFDVQGFFQSNLEVLEKTIELVIRDLSGKNILDMYAGCGTFSVFLSDSFEKVFLVEHNRDALVFAEENLQGKNHESYGVSGENWIRYYAENIIKNNGNFDAVVIDPPRSGMEKEVCKWLCSSKIPEIRSVSCNPSTHARDAAFLIKSGYSLSKLYLLDFYPNTAHIESLAVFSR